MPVKYTNNAKSTLAAGITAGATSFSVQVGDGAMFPAFGTGDVAYVTLQEGATSEVVTCTGRTGDGFACEPTTNAFGNGARVELRMTAKLLDAIKTDVATFAATHKLTRDATTGVVMLEEI